MLAVRGGGCGWNVTTERGGFEGCAGVWSGAANGITHQHTSTHAAHRCRQAEECTSGVRRHARGGGGTQRERDSVTTQTNGLSYEISTSSPSSFNLTTSTHPAADTQSVHTQDVWSSIDFGGCRPVHGTCGLSKGIVHLS